MKLIICDDELIDAQRAEKIIKKMPCANMFEIKLSNPQDVRMAVEEDLLKCDILIMDIQYEGESYNGIQLTEIVNEKLPICQIIFLSNVIEFAPFVYDTNHCYFVMKENMEIMLPRAIDKALEANETISNDIVEILSNGHKIYTPQSEITYIERNNRVLNIHTLKKNYPCYTSLRKIENILGKSFARCHGGFIVNLSYVSSIDGNDIYLKDGSIIPIGMRFFNDFKFKYLKYYSDRM